MKLSNIFSISEADSLRLRQRWMNLVSSFTTKAGETETIFTSIAEKYAESHRAYHNLSHIQALLELADSLHEQIHDHAAVQLAIWFHDVIYNPRQSDNEDRSAEFAADALTRLAVPAPLIATARQMILATKSHTVTNASDDLKLFLDCDLSILGAESSTYQAYSEAIRREYAWVPGFIYRRERAKILRRFLERESLYLTTILRERFETQSRINLADELERLP